MSFHFKHKERFKEHHAMIFNGWDQSKGKVWVAGGAARSYALNEPYKDFDLFFNCGTAFVNFYQHLCEQRGYEYIGGNENTYVALQKDACIFQLNRKDYFETPEDIFADFDFSICQFAVDANLTTSHSKQGIIDATDRELRAVNLKFPVVVLRRIKKFLDAGYTPCEGFWQDVVTKLKAIENTHATYDSTPPKRTAG